MTEEIEDVEFEWEFDPQERAELAFDLQEIAILAGKKKGRKPTLNDFREEAERQGLNYGETHNCMRETFEGSFASLMRSLGDTPRGNMVIQDHVANVYHESVDFPVTESEASAEELPSLLNNASKYMGSHSGLMDALGYFEEYMDQWGVESMNQHFHDSLQMRANDHRSLVEHLELEKGKSYDEMSFKYSTE